MNRLSMHICLAYALAALCVAYSSALADDFPATNVVRNAYVELRASSPVWRNSGLDFSGADHIRNAIPGQLSEIWGDSAFLRQLYTTNAVAFMTRVDGIVASHTHPNSENGLDERSLASAELALLASMPAVTGTSAGKYPEYHQQVLADMATTCLSQMTSPNDIEGFLSFATIVKTIREQIIPGYVMISFLYSSPSPDGKLAQRITERGEQTNFQLAVRKLEKRMLFSLFSNANLVFSVLPPDSRNEALRAIASAAALSDEETLALLQFYKNHKLPDEDESRKMREPTEEDLNAFLEDEF